MHGLGYYLGIQPLGAVATVIATVVLYLAFAWMLRAWGQRILASPSSFDLAMVTVLGALVGRATMGRNPTLVSALISLTTLLVCQYVAGRVRGPFAKERAFAVVVAGEANPDLLGRFRIDDRSLGSALRSAGISGLRDVALLVVEPNGQYSVLRSPVHQSVLVGVRDADAVHDKLRVAGLTAPE